MPYVMQVNFDSYWMLAKPSCVFRFRNREYRMLRGKGPQNRKEKDCILTILTNYDKEEESKIYRDIMIYYGCLSWEYHTPIIVGGGGGYGNSKKVSIRSVRRVDVSKRDLPIGVHYLSIGRIPYVYTKDQEDAIGLYREAIASGSPFYKFLCLWNILNIPSRKSNLVKRWINDTTEKKKDKIFPNNHINGLKAKKRDIADYLDEECRDAVSHVRRDSPQRTHIDPNDINDRFRIATSAYFLENLARLYIVDELKLDTAQFLFQFKNKSIPEYLTDKGIKLIRYGG